MLRNNRKKISGFSKLLRGSSSQTLKKTLYRALKLGLHGNENYKRKKKDKGFGYALKIFLPSDNEFEYLSQVEVN